MKPSVLRHKLRTEALKAAGLLPARAGEKPAPAGPCAFLGRELTGPERQAAGKGHARRWSLCLHAELPLGAAVCPCKGCGTSCAGYLARAGET